MKKALSAIVATLAVVSFTAVANAVPATGDTQSAISVVEGQDQGAKPVKKQPAKRKKASKKPKKKVDRKPPPTSSEAPAAPSPQHY
jgi:hypothetical protein